MTTFRYFAYGSNMLTARLQGRCGSARLVTVARVRGFSVRFSKKSVDSSGKVTLVASPDSEHSVPGVVFEIAASEQRALDSAEGPGYRRQEDFAVECLRTGTILTTCTYVAKAHHEDLKPYDWYLALVMAGIAEHGLDEQYAALYREVPYDVDPEDERSTRLGALRALQAAGIEDYREILP